MFAPKGGRRGGRGNLTKIVTDPGRITMTAVSAGDLIEFAFNVASADRIAGRPEWLYQTSYDVGATTPTASSRAQQKVMLQSLLADRFGLICHREVKGVPIYNLVAGRKPKLPEAKDPDDPAIARFAPRLVVHDVCHHGNAVVRKTCLPQRPGHLVERPAGSPRIRPHRNSGIVRHQPVDPRPTGFHARAARTI